MSIVSSVRWIVWAVRNLWGLRRVRPDTLSRDFWLAASAFLLSERNRHLEDIVAIDHKLHLIQKHHKVWIGDVAAAEFLTEDGIVNGQE